MVPQLSIIVPILNEAAMLPSLFANLAQQRGVGFELILCDGGSSDGSAALARAFGGSAPFLCRVLFAPPGRARQMNAGAAVANAEMLLFLHVDSEFPDSAALAKGVAALQLAAHEYHDRHLAGRFALRFACGATQPSLGYAYYEYKARLDRPGCIHGDQGFLLSRRAFLEIGPFDETLPILEDERLADAVRRQGQWLLLPAEIVTSARRFEQEGLWPRQLVNAILLTLFACGKEALLGRLMSLYPSPASDQRLAPDEISTLLDIELARLPAAERRALWRAAGRYLLANLWQIPCWLDVRQAYYAGTAVTPRWLSRCGWLPLNPPAANWLTYPAGWLGWGSYRILRGQLRRCRRC